VTRCRLRRLIHAALVTLVITTEATAQELSFKMTPAVIQQAIELAADEKVAARFLQSYVLQARTGVGSGPLIGHCSTPFSRVVVAAVAARRAGKALTVADVEPALVVPEFQILVLPQTAAYDSPSVRLENVLITSRATDLADSAIQPLRMASAVKRDYVIFGVPETDGGIVVAFPLNVVVAGKDVHAVFTEVVRAASGLMHCKDCVVPIPVSRIR